MPRQPNMSSQTRALLGALLAAPEVWRHGFPLARETGLASGTLYPLLARLESQEFLEARWLPPEAPGRPARHAYRLTAKGRALARERAAPATAALKARPA